MIKDSAIQRPRINDRALGKAISRAEHAHESGAALYEPLWTALPETTHIIGITGPPGAGKSTLADKLIACARANGLTVGVLAIDPSSPFSGGAILGDRVRMGQHTGDPGVFIRSMGNRTSSGGLAAATRSAVRLLATHGMDIIIVETVGVGQTELEIMNVADTVVVVLVPGLGDTIQMNKAGLLEIGDAFVVNQSDRPEARRTKKDLEQALMLGNRVRERPIIAMTQAVTGDGVEDLWTKVRAHFEGLTIGNGLVARRMSGQEEEIYDEVKKGIGRCVHMWLAGQEFQQLLDSRRSGSWTVGELTAEAAAAFLRGQRLALR